MEGIVLPKLKYGYRSMTFEWSELQEIIEVSKDLDRLSRSEKQQYEYELHKQQLKRTWKSVTDHILCTKFGIPRKQQGSFYVAEYNIKTSCETQTVVVRNDFPYCLPDQIEHWLLWKLGGLCTEEDVDTAKCEIQSRGGHCYKDFLHWINPPELQSLPDIDHVHILCLRNET